MTTHIISGLAVNFDDTSGEDELVGFRPNIQLEIFAPDNVDTFSYSIDPDNDDPDFPDVIGDVFANVRILDVDTNEAFIASDFIEYSIGSIRWIGDDGVTNTTTILNVFVDDSFSFSPLQGFDYIVVLGGEPLPEFVTQADFQDFIDNDFLGITSETPAALAPGQDIPFSSIPRCLIPDFDGAIFSNKWKEALWDKFYTVAPKRQRQCVEQYKIVKRA